MCYHCFADRSIKIDEDSSRIAQHFRPGVSKDGVSIVIECPITTPVLLKNLARGVKFDAIKFQHDPRDILAW